MITKIIKHLINGSFITALRAKRARRYIKNNLSKSDSCPKEYLEGLGRIKLGYKMNLDNPRTFNEKINWYKLNFDNELMYDVVDKIKAKDYVCSKSLNEIVLKTIKIYPSFENIKLEELPQKFVIKNTLDSGGVFVCHDKTKVDINDIKNKLLTYNDEIIDGRHVSLENTYCKGENKIIVEELIETKDGHAPFDYKFFCFNGEPKFLFVGSERDTNVKFDFYDIDFNWLNVKQGHKNNRSRPSKPKNYEQMLEVCRILSKDFLHVRVDLYNVDGKIYFGELTFFHFAGLTPFRPKRFDLIFGNYFILPNK